MRCHLCHRFFVVTSRTSTTTTIITFCFPLLTSSALQSSPHRGQGEVNRKTGTSDPTKRKQMKYSIHMQRLGDNMHSVPPSALRRRQPEQRPESYMFLKLWSSLNVFYLLAIRRFRYSVRGFAASYSVVLLTKNQ